eukprot:scaffold233334_cov40-Prasinocladus_malaysianus.AAC.1
MEAAPPGQLASDAAMAGCHAVRQGGSQAAGVFGVHEGISCLQHDEAARNVLQLGTDMQAALQ